MVHCRANSVGVSSPWAAWGLLVRGEIRRKYGRHYRLVTLAEKIAARGSKPRVILRIAVPTRSTRRQNHCFRRVNWLRSM